MTICCIICGGDHWCMECPEKEKAMANSVNTNWLTEARARCEAATPGPWRAENISHIKGSVNAGDKHIALANFYNHGPDNPQTVTINECIANQIFIAHARTDLPKALDWISRALPYVSLISQAIFIELKDDIGRISEEERAEALQLIKEAGDE